MNTDSPESDALTRIMLFSLQVMSNSSVTPMDYSPPGFPVYGISQASILEWVVISFSRKSSLPRDRTFISCVAGGFFLPLSHGGSISLKRRQLDSDLLLHLIGCTITLMSKLHSYS